MKPITISACLLLSVSVNAFAARPAAKIDDLAWMTGTWSAALGPNTLEENWIAPSNGSIASMVRMSGAAGVGMWEVITIEEKDGSLMMNVEQWSKGFAPRTPVQQLELAEIDGQRVKFTAVTEGSMKTLQYSRSADNVFTIEMVVPAGNTVKLDLKAK
ncbi:MAG: DUF6265 family protein [Pseudomonadota bacterium]